MKDTNILIVQTTCTHTVTLLVTQKSTQNALHHENAWAVVHVLGPSNIMLLTHIRFPTRLRSTASPILSHFHTLLRLRLTAPITASGFNSCHFSTNSLSLQKCFKTFSLYYFKHLMWFESLYLQLPCDLHRNGPRSRVQYFKDHLLYRKTYFMKESVLFSACIMTQAAILGLEWGLE